MLVVFLLRYLRFCHLSLSYGARSGIAAARIRSTTTSISISIAVVRGQRVGQKGEKGHIHAAFPKLATFY